MPWAKCQVSCLEIKRLNGCIVTSRFGLPFVYRVYRFFDGLDIFLGFGLVRMGSEGAFSIFDF